MPICTFTISKKTNVEEISQSVDICRQSLGILLAQLSIPEFDQEVRITHGDSTNMTIGFTVGGEEYPEEYPGLLFDPSDEKILAAKANIQKYIGDSVPFTIETSRNSAFMIIDPNLVEEPTSSSILEIPSYQFEGRITFSPEQFSNIQINHSGPEYSSEPYSSRLNTLKQELAKSLQIPFTHEAATFTDSPTAIDMRIYNDSEIINSELLQPAMYEVNKIAVLNGITEGTIWIQQEAGLTIY